MRKQPREIEGMKRVIHPSVSAPSRVHHGEDVARIRVDVDSRGLLALRYEAPRSQRAVLGEAIPVVGAIARGVRIAQYSSSRSEEQGLWGRLPRSRVRQP